MLLYFELFSILKTKTTLRKVRSKYDFVFLNWEKFPKHKWIFFLNCEIKKIWAYFTQNSANLLWFSFLVQNEVLKKHLTYLTI